MYTDKINFNADNWTGDRVELNVETVELEGGFTSYYFEFEDSRIILNTYTADTLKSVKRGEDWEGVEGYAVAVVDGFEYKGYQFERDAVRGAWNFSRFNLNRFDLHPAVALCKLLANL